MIHRGWSGFHLPYHRYTKLYRMDGENLCMTESPWHRDTHNISKESKTKWVHIGCYDGTPLGLISTQVLGRKT
jgi:hypothetical protein